MATDGSTITKICITVLVAMNCICKGICQSGKGPICKEFIASPTKKYIQQPVLNNGNYERNSFQCWRIRADIPSNKIKLSFLAFDMEMHRTCGHDNLTIFDGNDSNAFLIGIFCGSNIPKDMVSEKNVIYIEFKSDDTVESKGFRISYTAGKEEDLINDSKQNETKSQQTLTTVIVGGIIGGLVLITGIVVTICICASSRRCTCRPGSRTVNPYYNTERELSSNRRTNVLTRTDTFSYGEATRNTALPHVESPIFEYPFQINPPTYSESSSPPPYNGHEVIELQRLPSSPPPPYSTYDPNSFANLGDISEASLPGQTTFRI